MSLGRALGVGDGVGVQGALGDADQGVPESGAVVAGVVGPTCAAESAVVLVDRGLWAGEREERRLEQSAVLEGAAALEADAAGAVVGDRQVSVGMGCAVLAVELGLELPVDPVGVDHRQEVAAGLGELGGVQRAGVGQQRGLCPAPQQWRPGGRRRCGR